MKKRIYFKHFKIPRRLQNRSGTFTPFAIRTLRMREKRINNIAYIGSRERFCFEWFLFVPSISIDSIVNEIRTMTYEQFIKDLG